MSELKRHKRSDAIKWTATVVAFVFVAIILAGVCLQAFGKGKVKPSEWFKKDEQSEQTTPPDTENNVGLLVTPGESKTGIKLNVTKAAASLGESAKDTYTVTATVLPSYADDKTVDWSLEYVPITMLNSASGKQEEVILGEDNSTLYWAKTPEVEVDYSMDPTAYNVAKNLLYWIRRNSDPAAFVTVTPTSDGSATATVSCLQPFSASIMLKVTSRTDPKVFGGCRLEHYTHPEAVAIYVIATDLGSFDLRNSGRLNYEFTGSTSSSRGVHVGLQTTIGTQGVSEIGYPAITKVQVSETAEYVAELNKTDLFTSAATTHTKTLTYNNGQYRSMNDGKGFPLSLADNSLYNLSSFAARENAMCLALRNLGEKPFFVFHVTVEYPDAAVNKFGYTKTVVYDLPVYANLDSITISVTDITSDTSEIVF